MLVPMARVEIVGMRSEREAILAAVHRVGVVHVTRFERPESLGVAAVRTAASDYERIARVESALGRLGALLELVPPAPPSRASSPSEALGDTRALCAEEGGRPLSVGTSEVLALAEAGLTELEPFVAPLAARRKALEAEAASLAEHQSLVERLLPVAEGLVPLEGFETVALLLQPSYHFVVDLLRQELAALTHHQSEVVGAEAPDGTIAVLVIFNRRYADQIRRLLQTERVNEVHLPTQYAGRPFRDVLDEIGRRRQEIPAEMSAVRADLDGLIGPRARHLQTLRVLLQDRLDELTLVAQCGETDYTFALSGWVPIRELRTLERALDEQFGGRAMVASVPVARAEWPEIPILLENPRGIRSFELLMQLLAPPRYGTIDPTPFIAFFFPLFFGFILGDVGYGLVLLILALWVERSHRGPTWAQQAARVIQPGAVAAIGFGILFGELFGDLGRSVGVRPLLMDRSHAVLPLLLLGVGVGAVHVSLGLVLGIVNSFLQQHGREALSRAATLAGLVAVFAVLGIVAELLPRELLTPSLVVLALVAALLVWSAGIVGPLEIVSALGGILSYSRLVAVGLASVMLADVANQLAGLAGSVLVGILVGILLHGLNLALGLFSPSVQSLRLQYVEFFGRFFQPGGRPYVPFRCRAAEEALVA